MPLLYKTLIRPHLEYGNVIWGPHFKMDQKAVERVQRRATKTVPSLKDLPYQKWQERLNIPTLYYRHKCGDMIQVYKIMKGIDHISADIFFTRSPCTSTRGHSLKLAKPAVMKTPRSHSFSVRIVNDWNGLPEAAVNAESVNMFNNEVDRHWRKDMFILPL